MAVKKDSTAKLLPVMFGFFVMGFVDVVGIAKSYVKQDFALSETAAGLLPMMVFLWFAVFSIPSGLLMNRIGRKRTVLLSMLITFIAMLLPLLAYDFTMCLIAFALLGIGNTVLQVSLNPLLTNVVADDKLTSSLTLGQFVKAISSFLGPIVATFAATRLGDWKIIFPVYAAVTLLSSLWLVWTPIKEHTPKSDTVSFGQTLALLKEPYILALFMGILMIVGIDVGMNTSIPLVLMERSGLPLSEAGLGPSLYFLARTTGSFLGAIILLKYSAHKFFIISMLVGVVGYVTMMLFGSNAMLVYITTFIVGFACTNVFSIIFSFALQHKPDKANEISGLMIMGVAGGAIFPFLMGVANDLGGVTLGMGIILVCMLYLLFISLNVSKDVKILP